MHRTARERRRQRRQKRIQKSSTRQQQPGIASDFIDHLPEIAQPRNIVLWIRVSARDQRHKKRNTPRLREYDKFLRRELRKLGFSVCRKSFKAKVSGKLLVDERMQRKLAKAARYAKARGAVLGFFSTDRILRSEHYIDTNQGAQPTVEEFEMLKEVTRGVQLGSFMHPDESWQVVREEQTKLGGKCGRPKEWEPGDTKRRRIELRPEVLVLREQGVSVAEISERFAVPIRTVYSWLAA